MTPASPQSLLAELGERMGIPGLGLNATGTCQLVFDQCWLVTVLHEATAGRLAVNCPLGPAGQPGQLDAGTLLDLLRANFMGQGCAGAALSIGPDQRVYLQLALPLADLNVAGLQNAIEVLLNQAETWAQRLQRGASGASAASANVAGGSTAQAAQPPAWAVQRV